RVDQIAKMIPQMLGITLDDALQQNADLKQEYETDPQIRELIDIARKLEGTNRNAGTHAAGVVIANGPLAEHVPLQRALRKGAVESTRQAEEPDNGAPRARASVGEAAITTQWVMGDLEK